MVDEVAREGVIEAVERLREGLDRCKDLFESDLDGLSRFQLTTEQGDALSRLVHGLESNLEAVEEEFSL